MQPTGAPNARGRHGHKGFTLLELMITLVIMSILAAISISTYQRRVEREHLTLAGRELNDWLDEARGEALKAMRSCSVQINTANPLQATATITANSAACQGQRPLTIGQTSGSGIRAVLIAPSDGTLVFSPRGTVNTDLELNLSHDKAGQRCLRVSQPLGLIRLGSPTQGQCRYDSPF